MVKMAAKFRVTLTQRMDMYKYPFDRQILNISLFIRGKTWAVLEKLPDWLDTGHKTDKAACTTFLSETLQAAYVLKRPWIESRQGMKHKVQKKLEAAQAAQNSAAVAKLAKDLQELKDEKADILGRLAPGKLSSSEDEKQRRRLADITGKNPSTATKKKPQGGTEYKPADKHTVYLRVERRYQYELRKIVFPLFIIVLMAMASLGLEPDKTDARIAAPTGMMLATIGFQYVIQETMPKLAEATRLDNYITVCMLLIMLVVGETLFVKQWLEGMERFGGATLVAPPPPPGTPPPPPGTPPPPPPSTTTMLGESTRAINKQSKAYVQMEWMDFGSVMIGLGLWVLPHMLLFWTPKKWTKWLLQNSWDDALDFVDNSCKEIKLGAAKPAETDSDEDEDLRFGHFKEGGGVDDDGLLQETPTWKISRSVRFRRKRAVTKRNDELKRAKSNPHNLGIEVHQTEPSETFEGSGEQQEWSHARGRAVSRSASKGSTLLVAPPELTPGAAEP